MAIPKIIHQTWKTAEIPDKWKAYQTKVQRLHPDWEYRLWTDEENDAFVKANFHDFYATYQGFSKNIMRADVIRYLIMYEMGGLYLDLDYEMLRPFDLEQHSVVLPKNRSKSYGDAEDCIGNCFFASVARHVFWKDVINDLQQSPPAIHNYDDVIEATGPLLLTKIFDRKPYADVYAPERLAFHPSKPKSRDEYDMLHSNGVTYGIHHGWGSWKDRFTWYHLSKKIRKLRKLACGVSPLTLAFRS